MIKPETIEGVPEEEGYYFVNYTLGAYDFWICGPIEKDKEGNLYFFYQNGGVDIYQQVYT